MQDVVPRRAVLVFARSPRAEAAVKRLEGGERLFEAITCAWANVARHCGAALVIACAPAHRASFQRLTAVHRFVDQAEGMFGERLAASARAAFALQFDHLLITGIDAPPPEAAALDAAFDAVEKGRAAAVLSPSTDGGINYLVMTPGDIRLLEQFVPRDPALIARCRSYFEGRPIVETAAAADLDSRRAAGDAFAQPLWRPYRRLLRAPAPQLTPDRVVVIHDSFHTPAGLRAPPVAAP